jgi:uncharacterized protein YjlB
MPVAERLKRVVEKLTGIGRPSRREAGQLVVPRAPQLVRLRADGGAPNNPKLPLVIYRHAVRFDRRHDPAAVLEQLFANHGWRHAWRDGIYPFLRFHTGTHEVLGLARGHVTIQFGGPHGPKVALQMGDVAVLPAGTGHRRLRASRDLLVVGAYPEGGQYDEPRPEEVDLAQARKSIAAVPRPDRDPVYGAAGPLIALWRPALTPRQRQVARARRSRRRAAATPEAAGA